MRAFALQIQGLRGMLCGPASLATRVGELGLILSMTLTPLLLGGRHDFARFVYVISASLAAVGMFSYAALASQRIAPPRWPLLLFGCAVTLVALQICPLPVEVVEFLGPQLPEGVNGDAWSVGVGSLSVTPSETAEGMALLMAHGLLFLALWIRIRTSGDVALLCKLLLAATTGMAAIGIAQYLVGDGMVLGVYRHPHRAFTEMQGTFSNKNHFAHFLALGVGPALWWMAQFRQKEELQAYGVGVGLYWRRLLPVGALSLLAVATLATQSRGGVAAFCFAGILGVFLLRRARALALRQAVALIATTTLILVAVSFFGYEQITARLDDLFSADIETLDRNHARREIWSANIRALQASPYVGFGVGSHREVYPAFITASFPYEFTHAESGFLHLASECGVAGLVLLMLALALVAAATIRGIAHGRHALLWVALAPGLAASVLHSTVDFVWYIPGLLAPTLALVVAALRLSSPRITASASRGGLFWRVASVSCIASVALGITYGPARAASSWDEYLRLSVGFRSLWRYQMIRETPHTDPMFERTVRQYNDRMIGSLQRVVSWDKRNSRAHQRLASCLLQRFEMESVDAQNGMSLEIIADAARNGGFNSHEERMAWLDRALRDRAALLRAAYSHAKMASLCNRCEADAALTLGKLSFLHPSLGSRLEHAERAVILRPYDGGVLFEAGRQFWVDGKQNECLQLWRRAVRMPGSHLSSIASLAAMTMPASQFVQELDPGFEGFRYALKQYRVMGSQEDLIALCTHATHEANRLEEHGEEPPKLLAVRWRQASESLRSVGRFEQAVQASQKAIAHTPNDFAVRHELASALRLADRHDEADPHIRWCLARRPDLGYLRDWLEESAKRRTQVDENRRRRHSLYQTLLDRPHATNSLLESENTSAR